MKYLIILLLLSITTFSQTCDIEIKTSIYTGCFSKQYKNPLFIRYKLYKGGGDCDRSSEGFRFKAMNYTATSLDYSHSNYDEGHLANAEDFAFDCDKEKETFYFYNCVPQTPNLNRGIWKHLETEVRKLSQKDSLLIICGSIFGNQSIGSGVRVPNYCWKIVQSLTTKNILYCQIFTNNEIDNEVHDITREKLENEIGYKLLLK